MAGGVILKPMQALYLCCELSQPLIHGHEFPVVLELGFDNLAACSDQLILRFLKINLEAITLSRGMGVHIHQLEYVFARRAQLDRKFLDFVLKQRSVLCCYFEIRVWR